MNLDPTQRYSIYQSLIPIGEVVELEGDAATLQWNLAVKLQMAPEWRLEERDDE